MVGELPGVGEQEVGDDAAGRTLEGARAAVDVQAAAPWRRPGSAEGSSVPSATVRKRSVLPLPKLIVPTSSKWVSSRKVSRHSRWASAPSPSLEPPVDPVFVDLGDERGARGGRLRGDDTGREPCRLAAELHREGEVPHPDEHGPRGPSPPRVFP